MSFTLEFASKPEVSGPAPGDHEAAIEGARMVCERMLAERLGHDQVAVDIEIPTVKITAYAGDTAETLGGRLFTAIMAKMAAKKLGDAAPELVSELRRIRDEIFAGGKASVGAGVARQVKADIDNKIGRDFSSEYDAQSGNWFKRLYKGFRGHTDILDTCIGNFMRSLRDYGESRGVHLELLGATGPTPQVTAPEDDPTSIVYEESNKAFRARHEAVHITHMTQARVTILEQLLARRRNMGLRAGSVQDLSPEELAEAELRLDKLEKSVGNYPAFELAASNVGGTGGRKLRKPSDYGDKLKLVTAMMEAGLAKPDPSISYYKSFGLRALHQEALFDAFSWISPFVSGSAGRQYAWLGTTFTTALGAYTAFQLNSISGLGALAIAVLPQVIALPLLAVKRTWKIRL